MCSRYGVFASSRSWHSLIAPWQVEQMFIRIAVGLLREREGAGVERVGEFLVVLGDHAGTGAARPVQLDQVEVQQRRDPCHRAVQLGREAAAHAAGPVGELHVETSSSTPATYKLSSTRSGRVSISSK